jgi:hypothetical protein
MKTFEDQLYESVACVLPDLTVRKMSKFMGKSEGYWSSLMAQGLPVSNDALCCLISYLETRKVIRSNTPNFNQRIASAQRFISQEIVKRFNTEYWEYVHQAQDPAEDCRHKTEISRSDPMPFIVSHY